MLETTSCLHALSHASTAPLVQQVREDFESKGCILQVHELASMDRIFPELFGRLDGRTLEVELYPAPEESVDPESPWLFVHSSGSTGFPKSIPHKHCHATDWLRYSTSPCRFTCAEVADFALYIDIFGSCQTEIRFGVMGLPTFHGMGILFQLCFPACSSEGVVVNAPQYPDPPVVPNPQNMFDVSKLAECVALIALPSFIEVRVL